MQKFTASLEDDEFPNKSCACVIKGFSSNPIVLSIITGAEPGIIGAEPGIISSLASETLAILLSEPKATPFWGAAELTGSTIQSIKDN